MHEAKWAAFALLLGCGLADAAAAQELPGGASSLTETYRDWQVICVIQNERPRCAMVQNQTHQQSGQRLLALELRRAETGLSATLVLPFGLDLAAGVTLRVDARAPEEPGRFQTCLPHGCIVPLAFDAAAIERLRAGSGLRIGAQPAGGGQPVEFTVSLAGFTAAEARLAALP